ncbi:unnamed protein product [Lactuca saligna]|uniref:DDE Tnp4 domain-containing protein n=1 Tax=Lactuca saligna TaxID=75948 RepID=A0AA35VM24_LACSI|nr:unnamed protein product [Lactuca saligna]
MHVNFNFETQVKIVLASMAIHNYIRISGSGDATFQITQEESYIPRNNEEPDDDIEPHDEVSSTRRRSDDIYMSAVRDMIASQIFSMSNARARNDSCWCPIPQPSSSTTLMHLLKEMDLKL